MSLKTEWNQYWVAARDWMNWEPTGWREGQWDHARNKRVATFKGFFSTVLLLKLKNVMSRNWCLIFILLQSYNFTDFTWSYSHYSAAVWRAELDPSVALENFLFSKCTGKSYGFAYDCYKCAWFWNASSCSTNLQQFSNVMRVQQTRGVLARTVKQGRNV